MILTPTTSTPSSISSGDSINDSSSHSYTPAKGVGGKEEGDEDLGPLILRVHNVRAVAEACRVFSRLTSLPHTTNNNNSDTNDE